MGLLRRSNSEERSNAVEEAFKQAGLNTKVRGGTNFLADRISTFDLVGDTPNATAILLVNAALGTTIECTENMIAVKLKK